MSGRLVSTRGSVIKVAQSNGAQNGNHLVGPNITSSIESNGVNNGLRTTTQSSMRSTNANNSLNEHREDELLDTLLRPQSPNKVTNGKNLRSRNKLDKKSSSSDNLELLLTDDVIELSDVENDHADEDDEVVIVENGSGDNSKTKNINKSSSVESLDKINSEYIMTLGQPKETNVCQSVENIKDEFIEDCVVYRESKEAKTAAMFEDPGSDSSSESDSEFYRKLRKAYKEKCREKEPKVHPNYQGPTVRNELTITDLPEINQMENLTLEDDAYMELMGHVMSVVGVLVIIKSANESMALDSDTVLFNKDKSVLGQVFEVFGPVKEPFYSVRFNNEAEIETKGVKVGLPVYCCLSDFDLTKVVFQSDLQHMKGSDASWFNDHEPPESQLHYSDDEEERAARRRLEVQRRARREAATNENSDGETVELCDLNSSDSCPENKDNEQQNNKVKQTKRLNCSQRRNLTSSSAAEKDSQNIDAPDCIPRKSNKVHKNMGRGNAMNFSSTARNRKNYLNSKFKGTGGFINKQFNNSQVDDVSMEKEPVDVIYMKQLEHQERKKKASEIVVNVEKGSNWFSIPEHQNGASNYQWPSRYNTPKTVVSHTCSNSGVGTSEVSNDRFESSSDWSRATFRPTSVGMGNSGLGLSELRPVVTNGVFGNNNSLQPYEKSSPTMLNSSVDNLSHNSYGKFKTSSFVPNSGSNQFPSLVPPQTGTSGYAFNQPPLQPTRSTTSASTMNNSQGFGYLPQSTTSSQLVSSQQPQHVRQSPFFSPAAVLATQHHFEQQSSITRNVNSNILPHNNRLPVGNSAYLSQNAHSHHF